MGEVASLDDKRKGGKRAAKKDNQDGLFDKQVEDKSLERKLDERERKRTKRTEANAEYKTVDDKVKAKIDDLELEVGQVARVGKYRIELKESEAREVSFTTSPSKRIKIDRTG